MKTTPAQALQLLIEAIEAHAARSTDATGDTGFVKIDWIAPELGEARVALAEVGRRVA